MTNPLPHNPNSAKLNQRRRALLKLAFFGSSAFVLGKVLGPMLDTLSLGGQKNFKVVDKGEKLFVYDKEGNELLAVEKDDEHFSDAA